MFGKPWLKVKDHRFYLTKTKIFPTEKKYTRDCIRKVPNKKDKIKYCMKYIFCKNSLMYLNFCSQNHYNLRFKKTVFGYPDFFNMNWI